MAISYTHNYPLVFEIFVVVTSFRGHFEMFVIVFRAGVHFAFFTMSHMSVKYIKCCLIYFDND